MATAEAAGETADVATSTDAPRTRRNDGSSEDHWSVVLKKLAPQGYQKSPAWQQEIIERVVKQMTRRQKENKSAAGLSKEALARTIDLQALGISPEAAETFRAEEMRVAKSMRQLPGLQSLSSGSDGDGESKQELSSLEKLLADRSNQARVNTYRPSFTIVRSVPLVRRCTFTSGRSRWSSCSSKI
jgi:hypothetical protein|tara:strand:+ start:89 stop:646 length:558 start_codon:yes stop_codon:yes gene_type:complete